MFSYVGYVSDTNDMILFAKNHDLQDRITLYNMKVKLAKNKTKKSHTTKMIKESNPGKQSPIWKQVTTEKESATMWGCLSAPQSVRLDYLRIHRCDISVSMSLLLFLTCLPYIAGLWNREQLTRQVTFRKGLYTLKGTNCFPRDARLMGSVMFILTFNIFTLVGLQQFLED